MAFFTASATDGEELASGPDCWSAVFWHPATSRPIQKEYSKMEAKRRFIKNLPRAECSYSLNILSSGMKSISSARGLRVEIEALSSFSVGTKQVLFPLRLLRVLQSWEFVCRAVRGATVAPSLLS